MDNPTAPSSKIDTNSSQIYSEFQNVTADAQPQQRGSTVDLLTSTVKGIPDAVGDLASDAWKDPWGTGAHVVGELVTSGVAGTMFGYAVPGKGPAALVVTAVFTLPMAVQGIRRMFGAASDYADPSMNQDHVSELLARDFVRNTGDLALNLAGGYAGTAYGARLAEGSDAMGRYGQSAQRTVGRVENSSMLLAKKGIDYVGAFGTDSTKGNILGVTKIGNGTTEGIAGSSAKIEQAFGASPPGIIAPSEPPLAKGFIQQRVSILGRRIDQYSFATAPEINVTLAPEPALKLYKGSTHGHSKYSDGMGLPKELYEKGMAEGQQVTTITDHNHLAARDGIKGDDPRLDDQAGVPILAEAPIEYTQTQIDAQQSTVPDKFVALYGVEMGTTGSTHHVHDGADTGDGTKTKGGGKKKIAGEIDEHEFETSQLGPSQESLAARAAQLVSRDVRHEVAEPAATPVKIENGEQPHDVHVTGELLAQSLVPFNWKTAQLQSLEPAHLGGVNHVNLLEVPDFFEAIRQKKKGFDSLYATLTGAEKIELKPPNIIKYNDGDYKSMVNHLDQLTDSMGRPPIITLNHPRFLADNNPALTDDVRGRDYGRKSFKNDDEWRARFVKPYVRGIELIKGGALNPNPVDKVPTGMVDLKSYTGYLGLGVEAGPVFGRDFHFGDPGGNPGSTGFLATSLNKGPILDSLRERRTMASTHFDKLNGYMVANDKFPMGSILDQTVVPDVKLKMRVGGQIEPDADYTVKLYGDVKVLDGNDAVVLQTKKMTGQELIAANNEVGFDQINHKMGDNSLYFMEVTRKDSAGETERMWTSPIWIQPLVGTGHGLLTRLSAGSLNQWLPNVQTLTPGSH